MGLFDNPIGWINDNVLAPIQSVTNSGDIGRAVSSQLGSIVNVVKTPVDVAGALVKGDTQSAGRFISRGVGSLVNTSSFGQAQFVTDNKQYFTNSAVDKATLGFSSDYAGSMSAVESSRRTGDVSSADLNSSARFLSKSALIGGAALAVGKYTALSAADKAALGSQVSGAGTVAVAAKKGDVAGVVNAVAPGFGDTFNSYLPQLPSASPDLTSLYNDLFNSSGSAGAPGNLSSYTPSGTNAAPGFIAPTNAAAGTSVALLAVAGLAAFYLLKKRMA